MQDEVTVTQAEELFDAIYSDMASYAEWGIPSYREASLQTINEAFARHRHQAERETLARMEPVAFTALVGTRRERRRIESVNELMRLINGGSFISEIRRVSTLPPAPEAV